MSKDNIDNKKNKELDPSNKERNLQEYNSNDSKSEIKNGQKQQGQQHNHDENCGCDQ